MSIKNLTNKNDKKMIKYIYHLADIHIENEPSRFEEYKKVYDKVSKKIQEKKLDECLIVVAGDLIDFNSRITIAGVNMLIYFLEYFSNLCRMIIIAGNHDTNVRDINSIDLLDCCSKIKTKNNIYYLKESGLYKLNNIIFSVISVFDKKIIKPSKEVKEIVIALYHGFVEDTNDIKHKDKKNLNIKDFEQFDITMLGDTHTKTFLKPNISYASSLIQRHVGEPYNNHGLIEWNIETKEGRFIEIQNEMNIFVKIKVDNGKINEDILSNLDKNSNIDLTIVNDNSRKEEIDSIINNLKEKYNIKNNVKYESILKKKNMELKNGGYIEVFDMTNVNTMTKLFEEYILSQNYSDKDRKGIVKIHNNYINLHKSIIKKRKNNKIKILNLSFSNILSYGENNIIDFSSYKKNENILIKGNNGDGKSSLIEILVFALYDRMLYEGVNKRSICNIYKKSYKLRLELSINDDIYIIEKKGFRKDNKLNELEDSFTHENIIYKNNKNLHLNKENMKKYIENLIGLTYEEFIFFCCMPKETHIDFLYLDNTKKKKLFMLLMNTEYIEEINKTLKDDYLKKKMEHEKIYNENIEIINNYNNIKGKYNKKKHNELIQKRDELINKNTKIKSKIESMKENIKYIDVDEDYDELIESINDYKDDINDLENKVIGLQEELNNYSKTNIDLILSDDLVNRIFDYTKSNIKETQNISYIKDIIMEQIKENINLINNYRDKIDSLQNKINNTQKMIDGYKHEIDILNIKLSNVNKANKIKEENENIKNMISTKNEKVNINNKKIQELEIKIKEIEELKKSTITYAQYKKANNNIHNSLTQLDYLEKYINIMSIHSFQTYLIQFVCNYIQDLINEMLNKINSYFNVKILFKTSKLNNQEVSNISIYLNKKSTNSSDIINVNCASTSEKFIINLTLKIALQKFFKISIPSFIIIDELFEHISENRLTYLPTILNQINDTYDNVFLISHLNEIKKLCSEEIILINDGVFTKIKSKK